MLGEDAEAGRSLKSPSHAPTVAQSGVSSPDQIEATPPTRDLTPCPHRTCAETGPHAHPMIGEGLFGPPDKPATHDGAPSRSGPYDTMVHIGDAMRLVVRDVPCKCSCGATFTGPTFTLKPDASGYVSRRCSDCLAADEARLTEKHAAQYPVKPAPKPTYKDAAPLRRPFGYED